ncbi:MAG: DUF1844 domain-containing protein [Gemmatimonadales bacterium]|jgi:hypothetical protein|nr:MAG: DUF1844 domain-containing protein [Gemmatimonadales bacterium]
MNPHFASLVLGLAQQAQAALDGQLPPGAEQLGAPDPKDVAQALIDTLGMLEQKTTGHLDAEEHALLTQTLTSLRFRFVQASSAQ